MSDFEALHGAARSFEALAPEADFWTLRLVATRQRGIRVRQNVVQPLENHAGSGAFIFVIQGEGAAYAATADLRPEGLRAAAERALALARAGAGLNLIPAARLPRPQGRGHFRPPLSRPWEPGAPAEILELLRGLCAGLKTDPRILDWQAAAQCRSQRVLMLSSAGARIEQTVSFVAPELAVLAAEGSLIQRRSYGTDQLRQGGLEILEDPQLQRAGETLAGEALALLAAPPCPNDTRDLLLLPCQMLLQIHESIGHPLELDRILGDERNYAGSSFVTPEMVGSYQYGSELLNVSFDPLRPEQLASYAFDDEGTPASRQYLIRAGRLERTLGGAASQARAGLLGTACTRACDWNRPPIDRMANLNLEPGDQPLEALIAGIERGVLMASNRSWSIDHQRDKFQFGCEYGRLIEDGELKGLVRDPNYRDATRRFWHKLAAVGDAASFQVLGTRNCGKGEPNQAIAVGHAAPACVFRGVEVFSDG